MERFATEHYQSGLSQMEVVYETKQKEARIAQLQRQKQWYLLGGVLTALVLLLSTLAFFLLWRGLKLRRRTALIEAKLEGEKAERVRIARDLHDRMGGLLTAIRQNLPEESEESGLSGISGISGISGKSSKSASLKLSRAPHRRSHPRDAQCGPSPAARCPQPRWPQTSLERLLSHAEERQLLIHGPKSVTSPTRRLSTASPTNW